MLNSRLKIGKYFGIQLYVHWSFALLVGYVAFAFSDGGIGAIAFGVALLLGMFLCVTLHEYGHALAARRFGVPTLDITLLPIGGVARLQRMPRVPWQELVVAVAGPAVNVAIASLILLGLAISGILFDRQLLQTVDSAIMVPSALGYLLSILLVNTTLVVFNMIPAFPMDGGRVLRSLLAMVMDYRRATVIASRIGAVCAVIMALVAIQLQAFIPVLIALFIGYVGFAEARQVEVMEAVRGVTVRDAMVADPQAVTMDTPLWEIARRWQSIQATELPVTSLADTVVGTVKLKTVADAVEKGLHMMTPVGELADHEARTVDLDEDLEGVVFGSTPRQRQLPVVDLTGRLVGVLDLDTVLARGRLHRHASRQSMAHDRIDVLS